MQPGKCPVEILQAGSGYQAFVRYPVKALVQDRKYLNLYLGFRCKACMTGFPDDREQHRVPLAKANPAQACAGPDDADVEIVATQFDGFGQANGHAIFFAQAGDGIGDGFKVIQQFDGPGIKAVAQFMGIQAPVIVREAHSSIDDGSRGGKANDVGIWRVRLGQVLPDCTVRRVEVATGQGDFPGETWSVGIGNGESGIGAADVANKQTGFFHRSSAKFQEC